MFSSKCRGIVHEGTYFLQWDGYAAAIGTCLITAGWTHRLGPEVGGEENAGMSTQL